MNILNFVNRRADDILIGYYLGVIELGYYTVAYRIFLALTDLLTGFANQVAFPVFSRLQSDPGRTRQVFFKATEFMSYISFPLFGGFALIAPDLIKVFFGYQWLPSVPVLQILMTVGALHSILYFHTSLMLASGASDKRFRLTLLNAVINIIAFTLVVRWGIVAIALAYAIRAYFLAPIELLAVKYVIGIDLKEYTGQFVTPLISTLFMIGFVYGGMFLFNNILSNIWRLIAGIISGLIVYIFVLSFLNPSVLRQGWVLFRSLLVLDTVNG
jgi:PST family polysaccharide transporter